MKFQLGKKAPYRLAAFLALAGAATANSAEMHLVCGPYWGCNPAATDGNCHMIVVGQWCDYVADYSSGGSSPPRYIDVATNGGPGGGDPLITDGDLSKSIVAKQTTCKDVTTSRPVVITTGNKILPEFDFSDTSPEIPLAVNRNYDKNLARSGAFGPRWAFDLEQTLSFDRSGVQCHGRLDGIGSCDTSSPITSIYANRNSGFAQEFTQGSGGVWVGSIGTMVAEGSGWRLTTKGGQSELYDSYGRPVSVVSERGVGLTYSYNANNQLAAITHTTGRSISFTWSGSKIVAIVAPNGKAYGYGYNSSGYLASVVYPDNLGTRTYHYEDASQPGGLTGISINGTRFSRYTYQSDGKVASSGLDNNIEKSIFAYDSGSTSIANALAQTTVYDIAEVAGVRQIMGVTRPLSPTCAGGVRETVYNTDGNITAELDALDNKTTYAYDSDDRLVERIAGIGPADQTDQRQITQYVWDSLRKTRLNQVKVFGANVTAPLSTTTYSYYPDGDPRARLLQSVTVTNHGGGSVGTLTTTYDYTLHPNGLLSSSVVDGPLAGAGDAVTSTYDTAGNLLTVRNSLNHAITYANYNALGQPGSVTSANGAVVNYTYNARGQILTEVRTVNGIAQTTTTTYDTRGRPVTVTTPDGESVNTTYDAYDRVTSTNKIAYLEDLGEPGEWGYEYNRTETQSQALVYNLLSQPLSVTTTFKYASKEWDADRQKPINVAYTQTHHRISFEYDIGGFLSRRLGEHGQSLTYTYDANGDLYQIKDALLNTTTYTYDRHRRVSSIADAGGGTTQIAYTPVGLRSLVTDARNNSTAYVYDGLGNLLSQTSPDTGMTTFTYNSVGQRTQMQRADLTTIAYTYDAVGRLQTMSSGGQTRTMTYDSCANGKGLLCVAAQSGGAATSVNFTYNPWGQLATRQDSLSGVADTTAYSYDGMHRLTGISYPSGISAGYGYVGGNLTAITATVGGVTNTVATLSGHQAFGPPAYLGYGNGLWRGTNYDTDRRVTGISVSGDPAGLIQSLTYAFDSADRLTDITNGVDSANTWDFTYDTMSRVIGAQAAGSPVGNFGYDLIGNRVSRGTGGVQNTTLNYPSSSSRLQSYVTSALTRNYGYNANGDTTSMTGTDGVANAFAYDPFGKLSTHARGGVITNYTVNALDQRMAKSNSSTSSRYVYAGFNQMLAENTNGTWTSYIYNGSEPVAMVRGGQIYYIHTDHIGRPESVTNSSQAVVWKANNNAFSRGIVLDTIGGLNFGFPGQYWDSESSVWHNGYRDYEQTGGRYLQSDPIGLGGGVNTYSYVGGNPVTRIDPLGLRSPNGQEAAFLSSLFGDCFDTGSVDINGTSNSRASSLRGGKVSIPTSLFHGGDVNQGLDLSSAVARSTLAHEVFHVWQRQQGANITSSLAIPQVGYSLGIGNPYTYGTSTSAGGAVLYFNDMFSRGRYEGQAQMWEDSYLQSDQGGLAGEIWEAIQASVAGSSCGCKK